jgi:hypothetical protein
VWHAVSSLRRRTPKGEDWTNWLIGDWVNQADTQLGRGAAERIFREEELEHDYTQHLWRLSGATLMALQWAEFAIGICWRLLDPSRASEMAAGAFSSDAVTRKRTLGQLNRLLKERRLFVDDFEQRLDRFVSDRNRFAHHLWVETPPTSGHDHVTRMEILKNREKFILSLVAEAYGIGSVFKGLFATIGVALAERDNVSHFGRWLDESEYDRGQFAEVQRKL